MMIFIRERKYKTGSFEHFTQRRISSTYHGRTFHTIHCGSTLYTAVFSNSISKTSVATQQACTEIHYMDMPDTVRPPSLAATT